MTAPLMILDQSPRRVVVRGNAWPYLTAAGIKPFHCGGTAMGFIFDPPRLADFCAYLDSRRIPYRIKRGDSE